MQLVQPVVETHTVVACQRLAARPPQPHTLDDRDRMPFAIE